MVVKATPLSSEAEAAQLRQPSSDSWIICCWAHPDFSDRTEEERLELEQLAYEAIAEQLLSSSARGAQRIEEALQVAHIRVRLATHQTSPPALSCFILHQEKRGEVWVGGIGNWQLYALSDRQLTERFRDPYDPYAAGRVATLTDNLLGSRGILSVVTKELTAKGETLLLYAGGENTLALSEQWKEDSLKQGLRDRLTALVGRKGRSYLINTRIRMPSKQKKFQVAVGIMVIGISAVILTGYWLKKRQEWVSSAYLASAIEQEAAPPGEEYDSLLSLAGTEMASLSSRAESPQALQLIEELEQIQLTLEDQQQLISTMRQNESALNEALEVRDEYIQTLKRELQMWEEGMGAAELAGHSDPASDTLQETYEELSSILADESSRFVELREACEAERKKLSVAQEALNEQESHLTELQTALQKGQRELFEKEAEIELLKESYEKAFAQLAATQEEQIELQDQKMLLLELKDEQQELIATQRQRIQEIEAHLHDTQDLLALTEEEFCELRHRYEAEQAHTPQLEEECKRLREAHSLSAQELSQSEQAQAELVAERTSLQEALHVERKRAEELIEKLAVADEKLSYQSQQLAKQQQLQKDQQTSLHSALEEASAFRSELVRLREALDLAHRERQKLEEDLSQAYLASQEGREELRRREKEYVRLQEEKQLAKEAHVALQQEQKALEKRVEQLLGFEERYHQELKLRQERDQMLVRLAANIQGWKEAVASLEESRSSLARELSEMREYQQNLISGRVEDALKAPSTQISQKSPSVASRENRSSVTNVHLVSPGETLESIARRYYGSSQRWRDIFNANRDALRSEDEIRVGMALIIP